MIAYAGSKTVFVLHQQAVHGSDACPLAGMGSGMTLQALHRVYPGQGSRVPCFSCRWLSGEN